MPGLKYFRKYTAEYTQKITPNAIHINPRYLVRGKSRNPRLRNSGYLNITVNDRIIYGRQNSASLGPHPKSVIDDFIVYFLFSAANVKTFHKCF
jgi:hypothetical protein